VRNLRRGTDACVLIAFLMLGSGATAALADPIGGYTVTNLGSGPITLTTGNGSTVSADFSRGFYGYYGGSNTTITGGAPVVSVSNGQAAYSFTFTPDTLVATNQGNTGAFPLAVAAPIYDGFTYGNPANAFSFVIGTSLMNSQGLVAAVDTAGVYGHYAGGTAYTVQENANGSWGAPTTLWSGSSQVNFGVPGGTGVNVVGINNLNQILGTTSNIYGNNPAAAVVYDTATHTLTSLTNLTDAAGNLYQNNVPYAIDDQGRILLKGTEFPTGAQDTLLLTPIGQPVDEVPVPEPGSVAVTVLAMAAFAAQRVRERRRRRN
jgi:hypothetical protein